MTHLSPAVNLVWALLSIMLGSFLVFHLWSFDRFKCLKWNQGPDSGTFKRVMTYSYLTSIPLFIVYSVGFAIIKYNYGFTDMAFAGIIPTPSDIWSKIAKNAIMPLYLSISLAWALEMVTHLEELCFWLFLVNSSSSQQDWFRSLHFKIWAVGSCIAVIAMPLITIITRDNVYKCEAYTFLAGGLGSLSITICFLPVLRVFPSFMANLKGYNVEPNTLLRLTLFHELNCIRILFRFLFTIPVVILGIDGVRPHQHINENMLATDLLAILAGISCVVSSGLTLVIFFPRSFEGEIAMKEQQRSRRKKQVQEWQSHSSRSHASRGCEVHSYMTITHATDKSEMDLSMERDPPANRDRSSCYKSGAPSESGLPAYDSVVTRGQDQYVSASGKALGKAPLKEAFGVGAGAGSGAGSTSMSMSLQPNRRKETGDVELGAVLSGSEVELARARLQRDGDVSELVYYWRSPLEIGRPAGSQWQRQV